MSFDKSRKRNFDMDLHSARKDSDNNPLTVAIFCRELVLGGDPFSSDYYWQAYLDLLLALKARGLQAYFVTDNNSYLGYGLFRTAYTTDTKTTIEGLTLHNNVQVDLVFDRGGFIGRDVATINPAILQKIGMNKIEMYKHFADLQPDSVVCEKKTEVKAAFSAIDGDKVVVKEPEGCGGKQVYIGPKDKVLRQIPESFPVLVQEFLDTSAGIPGYISGVHDVRISICGGEFIGFYVRSAKAGSYHSNVSRGGKMVFYDVEQIPPAVAEAARTVDAYFKDFPRYYAVDFMFTPKGWKMLELNPYLALLPATDGPRAEQTLNKLADYLAAAVRNVAESKNRPAEQRPKNLRKKNNLLVGASSW